MQLRRHDRSFVVSLYKYREQLAIALVRGSAHYIAPLCSTKRELIYSFHWPMQSTAHTHSHMCIHAVVIYKWERRTSMRVTTDHVGEWLCVCECARVCVFACVAARRISFASQPSHVGVVYLCSSTVAMYRSILVCCPPYRFSSPLPPLLLTLALLALFLHAHELDSIAVGWGNTHASLLVS